MNIFIYYIVSIIAGLLTFSTWQTNGLIPAWCCTFVIIPILWIENKISTKKNRRIHTLGISFVYFFTINAFILYWLFYCLEYLSILLYVYNAVFYSLTFYLFAEFKNRFGKKIGYLSFISLFVTLEYIQYLIPLAFPALIFGVIPATDIRFIQWYEYTGVLGGSIWVLLCNILLFEAITNKNNRKKLSISWGLTFFIPLIFSIILYKSYKEKEHPINVVTVQPNFDPYEEKFAIKNKIQVDTMIHLAKKVANEQTDFILLPETCISNNIWANNIDENEELNRLKDSVFLFAPNADIVAGVDMMEYYISQVPPSKNAHAVNENVYIDFFNACVLLSNHQPAQYYKKSKLTPGSEYLPFKGTFLENWLIKLGCTAESRGRQERPSLLSSNKAQIMPIICYESLYSEYVSKFSQLGGDVIFIITNDGWWKKSIGETHHFRMAQIRSIENRRSVIRCGNTGISAAINQKGDIIQQIPSWTQTAFSSTVNKNKNTTFYSKHGDYVAVACNIINLILISLFFFSIFKNKKNKKNKPKNL